jgi:hypothetical protein
MNRDHSCLVLFPPQWLALVQKGSYLRFNKYPFSFFQNINVIHGTHTHCVTIEIYRFDWTLFFRIGAL